MSKAIYITDPVVAAQYHVAQGEWTSVADDAEADWLVDNHHGYSLAAQRALPAAGFVHPEAPLPFEPYSPILSPSEGRPSTITIAITNPQPNQFDVQFGGSPDSAQATGRFTVKDDAGATLADVTYTQPASATRQDSCAALHAALTPYAPPLVLVKNGALLDVRGANPPVVGGVTGSLTVPAPAPPPARRGILRRRTP